MNHLEGVDLSNQEVWFWVCPKRMFFFPVLESGHDLLFQKYPKTYFMLRLGAFD